MGAFKGQLATQFLMESFLLNFMATILAVLLVIAVWPLFADLRGDPLNLL